MSVIKIIFIEIALLLITTMYNGSVNGSTICETLLVSTNLFTAKGQGLGLTNYRYSYSNYTHDRTRAFMNTMEPDPNIQNWRQKLEIVTLGYNDDLLRGALLNRISLRFLTPEQWCSQKLDVYEQNKNIKSHPYKEIDIDRCTRFIVPTLFSPEVASGGQASILQYLYKHWSKKDLDDVKDFLASIRDLRRLTQPNYPLFPVHPDNPLRIQVPLALSRHNPDMNVYIDYVSQLTDPNGYDLGVLAILYTIAYFDHVGTYVYHVGQNSNVYPIIKEYCNRLGTYAIQNV